MSVRSLILAAVLAFTPLAVSAHSVLTASEPGQGAAVSAPQELSLQFNKPLRLVFVTLTDIDGQVVTLDISSFISEPSADFILPLPALAPGGWTITWSGLGTDGHAMREDFTFTIVPE